MEREFESFGVIIKKVLFSVAKHVISEGRATQSRWVDFISNWTIIQ